jgi:hypothetical protein
MIKELKIAGLDDVNHAYMNMAIDEAIYRLARQLVANRM